MTMAPFSFSCSASCRRRTGLGLLAGALTLLALLLAPKIALAEGKPYFLVATPDLPDPVFEESVILMLPQAEGTGEEQLVVGLIVNKPTSVQVKQIFPKSGDLKGKAVSAFFGGPVEPSDPSILVRGPDGANAKGSTRLLDDLYLITDPDAVADLLKKGDASGELRLIMGRSQWSDDQLHAEIAEGSWYKAPATVDDVFTADPIGVWRDLVKHSQLLEVDGPASPAAFELLRCAWPVQVPRGGSPAAR